MLANLHTAATTVMFYEGARFHQQRFTEHGSRLADLADLVREGLEIPVERYHEAKRYIGECKTRVTEIYHATPVILVPAATGPAPLDLAINGRSRNEFPVDRPGNYRDLHPHGRRGDVAARVATDRRSWAGFEGHSHGRAAVQHIEQRTRMRPLVFGS